MSLAIFEWSSDDAFLNVCVQWVLGRCRQLIKARQRQNLLPASKLEERPSAMVFPESLDMYLQGRTPIPTPRRFPDAPNKAAPSRLDRLREVLGLEDEAFKLFCLAIAPDISPEVSSMYSFLLRKPAPSGLTLALASSLLDLGLWEGQGLRRHLQREMPLAHYDLVRLLGDDRLESHCGLCPNPDLYHYLQDSPTMPPILSRFAQLHQTREAAPLLLDPREDAYLRRIEGGLLDLGEDTQPAVLLYGPGGTGKLARAERLARSQGRELLVMDFGRLGVDQINDDLFRSLQREALLRGRWLYLVGLESVYYNERRTFNAIFKKMEEHPEVWMLSVQMNVRPIATSARPLLFISTHLPSSADARLLWQKALEGHTLSSEINLAALAHQYPLSMGDTIDVIKFARQEAHMARSSTIDRAMLLKAINSRTEHKLNQLAVHIKPIHTLEDLVTSVEVLEELRTMIARGKHYVQVFEQWGFKRMGRKTKGFTALFSGKSGTGKTMAASIIAKELGLAIYKVDLGQVVSKYIGETEKNLGTLFDEADRANVVLLFDEADSLFAKRTGVKSSNDRYANMEVNYLLQRLDDFSGIAVLTSNFGDQMDDALMRRLDYKLEFPFPDEKQRASLWQTLLPPEAEYDDDIEFDYLGETFEMAGGHIRNALLRAAFMAAEHDTQLNHELLFRSAYLEMRSMGHLIVDF